MGVGRPRRGSRVERQPRAGCGAGVGLERARPGPARCGGAAAGLTWNRRGTDRNRRHPSEWRRRNGRGSNLAARRHGQSPSGAEPRPIAGPCVTERQGLNQSQSLASGGGGVNRERGCGGARGGAEPMACGCVRLRGGPRGQSQPIAARYVTGGARPGRGGAAAWRAGYPTTTSRWFSCRPTRARPPGSRRTRSARGGGSGGRPGDGGGGGGASQGGGSPARPRLSRRASPAARLSPRLQQRAHAVPAPHHRPQEAARSAGEAGGAGPALPECGVAIPDAVPGGFPDKKGAGIALFPTGSALGTWGGRGGRFQRGGQWRDCSRWGILGCGAGGGWERGPSGVPGGRN